MNLENIYLKTPYFIQFILLNIKGYLIKKRRFNKDFIKFYNFYKKNNPTKIDQVQLKLFVLNACKSVFWKERFEKYKIDLHSDNLELELLKLPVLTRLEVINNTDDIVIKDVNEPIDNVKTSGSTGSPLRFVQTMSMENKQWAVWWRYRFNHGITLDTWCAWFGGKTIMSVAKKEPPFWHINYFNKQLMFSGYHLSKNTVHYYFNKLKKSKIKWLHGYPSQISYFASLIISEKLGTIKNIEIISLGSENLLNSQLKIIKDVFNAKIIQHYGLSEGVANISQDIDGELVVDNDFCLVNFVPHQTDKNVFKIIGTNYNNLAFPLIRYDTGDVATIIQKDNKQKLISIDGRSEDYITLLNGIKLGRLDHIFKDISNIIEAQIYQKKDYSVVIRIVKNTDFTLSDESKLIQESKKRIGKKIPFSIEYIDKVKRNKSGKLKFVISEIK